MQALKHQVVFQKSILNLAIETEATVEEETVSCEITTPFQSVDSPTLQHPESQLIGGNESMETSEPFYLPIDIETTLEEDSVSSDTTTTSTSVALPPQQDPETEIMSGSDLIETSGPLNLQIENETTVEEETFSCDTNTAFRSVDSTTLLIAPLISNCYEEVMSELCKLNVLNVCCDKHEDSLPYLIMQYVHIRFHTESKRFRNIHLSSDLTQMKTNKKLSRIPKSTEIQFEKGKEKKTANTTDKT